MEQHRRCQSPSVCAWNMPSIVEGHTWLGVNQAARPLSATRGRDAALALALSLKELNTERPLTTGVAVKGGGVSCLWEGSRHARRGHNINGGDSSGFYEADMLSDVRVKSWNSRPGPMSGTIIF